MRATWHDENFRRWHSEALAPAVLGDDGEFVRLTTPETLYKYAAKLYCRSQTVVVIPDSSPSRAASSRATRTTPASS